MNFNTMIGQRNKQKILNWFNDGKPKRNILIIQGRSGNGKTSLITSLAHTINLELQVVEPDFEDTSSVLRTINTSLTNHKIILVDDFDTFHASKRNILYSIINISIYPVVVTCTKWKFKGSIFGKAQYLRLQRPLSSEIKRLLRRHNIDRDIAHDISENANSVAEALQSSVTGFLPQRKTIALSNKDKLQMLKQRNATESIEKPNINFYYWSIRGYDDDAVKTLIEFSYYDYLNHQRYQKIPPFILNNMSAPIENITLKPRPPKRTKKTEKKKKTKKKVKQPEKKKPKVSGLDQFLE